MNVGMKKDFNLLKENKLLAKKSFFRGRSQFKKFLFEDALK